MDKNNKLILLLPVLFTFFTIAQIKIILHDGFC